MTKFNLNTLLIPSLMLAASCGGGSGGSSNQDISQMSAEESACFTIDRTNISVSDAKSSIAVPVQTCPADLGELFKVSNPGDLPFDYEILPSTPEAVAITQPASALAPGNSDSISGTALCQGSPIGTQTFLVRTLRYTLNDGSIATTDELLEICGVNANVGNTEKLVSIEFVPAS